MRTTSWLLVSTLAFFSQLGLAQSKTGEFVRYSLDGGSRSSSIIESGTMVFNMGAFVPSRGKSGAYQASLNYDLDILFAGRQTGSIGFYIPSEYFADDFMAKLRVAKLIDLGEFKVKYLGQRSVQTKTGFSFPACDHILVYDIKTNGSALAHEDFIANLTESLLRSPDAPVQREFMLAFDNAKIRFHVTKGIPAIGAVQMDIAATVSGFDAIAGFDYLQR